MRWAPHQKFANDKEMIHDLLANAVVNVYVNRTGTGDHRCKVEPLFAPGRPPQVMITTLIARLQVDQVSSEQSRSRDSPLMYECMHTIF